MSDYEEAVKGLRRMRPPYIDVRIKVTGKLENTGIGIDPTIDASPGNLWVHGYPRGANVQVIIGPDINPHVSDVRVYVGQNMARQAVAFAPVVDQIATDQYGPGLIAITATPNMPTLGLIEGRLEPSTLGGMYVHVNGFVYDYGQWVGGTWVAGVLDPTTYDFDVSAYVPATVDTARWLLVYFDPASQALYSAAGAETFVMGNVWYLDAALIDSIAYPPGMIPLGAVALVYGQTTLDGARFASTRQFINPHDSGGQWIVNYAATIPAGVTAVIPRGVVVAATGTLTINGALVII